MEATTTATTAPKVRTSATTEEIEFAISGDLKSRNPVLPAPEGARPLGRTLGLPILMTWCYAFREEERKPAEQRRTDAQLTEWFKTEFPNRETAAFNSIAGIRRNYNSGRFTKGRKPKVQSVGRPTTKATTLPVAPTAPAKPPIAPAGVAALKAAAARVAAKKATKGTGKLADPAR